MGTLPDVWGGQHGPLWRSSKQCGVSGAWNARYAPHDANAMRRPSPGTSTRMLPEASASHTPDDAPLGLPRVRQLGALVASGGAAGHEENPHFQSNDESVARVRDAPVRGRARDP